MPVMNVSIVIPLLNESENVSQLWAEVRSLAEADDRIAEIIFVDDGSADDTFERLKEVCGDTAVREAQERSDSRIRCQATLIRLRRNFGQTAALSAGFDAAAGDVIVPMDGDLQNDPADVPRLLELIEQGYDVVSGWRKERKDAWLTRRVPSWIANRLISKITSVRLHDYGCSLKAYRKDVLQGLHLYGEMHRFIPSLASWMGVRVTEVPVNHRPRRAGKSKYGLSRIPRVILDLILVKFLISYVTRPIQVFGKIGLFALFLGLVSGGATVLMKVVQGEDMTGNPIFMLTVLLLLMGFQFILTGLVAEINVRTYYESQKKPTYVVRERVNCGER